MKGHSETSPTDGTGKTPPNDGRRANAFRPQPFKIYVVVAFVALLAFTVVVLSAVTYAKNRAAALELVRLTFRREAGSVIDETRDYMDTARALAEVSRVVLADPEARLEPEARAGQYLLRTVTTHDAVEQLYFGTEDGEFLLGASLAGNVHLKHVPAKSERLDSVILHFGAELEANGRESIADDPYDPRARPWYIGAKESGAAFWTEPYIFHASGKPGITVACPARREDGTLAGVVGADITLAGLCGFLRSREIGPNGEAFVLDSGKKLLASSADIDITIERDGEIRRLLPAELPDPTLREAMAAHEASGERSFSCDAGGKRNLAYFTEFPAAPGRSWTIAIIAPEDDFLGPLRHTLRLTMAISGSVLALSVLLGFLLARQISRPIEYLTDEVLGVRDLDLAPRHHTHSVIHEIREITDAVASMKKSLRAFSMYVPAELVRQLIADGRDIAVGGEDRELTLFFSDIQSFSGIAESLHPEELMARLSEYFDCMDSAIAEFGGTVDKFVGDGIVAFWGAPRAVSDHPARACRAALHCLEAARGLNARWQSEDKVPFRTRIGIHTGDVVVGNLGSARRLNYSVIGDNVNLASRLEGANKVYGTQLIVSEETSARVRNAFLMRPLDHVIVMGRSGSSHIYELMAEAGTAEAARLAPLARDFGAAYDLYMAGSWPEALEVLLRIAAAFPDDSPTTLYIGRCRELINRPPGPGWSGVSHFDHK